MAGLIFTMGAGCRPHPPRPGEPVPSAPPHRDVILEGGPGGYLSLAAGRGSGRGGEARSEATVGRGKAKRIPPPSTWVPPPLRRLSGGTLLPSEFCRPESMPSHQSF